MIFFRNYIIKIQLKMETNKNIGTITIEILKSFTVSWVVVF